MQLRALAGIVGIVIVAGCGTSAATPPDAAPADALEFDAHPDPGPGMLSAPAQVELGQVEVLAPSPTWATVTLTNRGARSLFLYTSRVHGAGFALDTVPCNALAPGDSCDMKVQLTGAQLGAATGGLRVESSGGTVEVALTARVVGRIDVERDGGGSGQVAIAGSADCGSPCTVLGVAPVLFTATAHPGSRFGGWSWRGCGAAPTCLVVPGLVPARVRAIFVQPGESVVRFELDGDVPADAAVSVGDLPARGCVAPCALTVPTGVTLTIGASTPSTFVGLSGACATSEPTCTITPAGDATITISARRDDSEALSVWLPWPAWRAVMDSAHRIALTTSDHLIALAADGTPRWGLRTFGSFVGISADDHLYATTTSGISRIDRDGAIEWGLAPITYGAPVAVAGDGSLATVTSTGVNVFGADGALRWHVVQAGFDELQTASFDGHGNLWLERRDPTGRIGFERYAPDGTRLAPFDPGITSTDDAWTPIRFDVDATLSPILSWTESSQLRLRRTGRHGFETHAQAALPPVGVVLADDDSVWWAEDVWGGLRLEHLEPGGTTVRTVLRPRVEHARFLPTGAEPEGLARGADGRAVVVGRYQALTGTAGFVQVFGW